MLLVFFTGGVRPFALPSTCRTDTKTNKIYIIVFPLYINQEQVKQKHKIYSKVHVNESVVVLHCVHTYELQSICWISIKMCHTFSFTGTNKIILLCEDLIEFFFLVVVVAVLFLFLPKRLSKKGLFLVFEPIEMVIDLLYMQAQQIGNTIKEWRSFIWCW